MKGIDVSYHNGVIDWAKVRESAEFAIIRAGYGKSTMDKQFINNICGAHTAGLKIGVYWFIYAANKDEAVLNAKMCEKCIEGYKDIITMRVWADWEYDSDKRNPQTKESRTDIVKAFCNYLSGKGYETGVYSNVDYLTGKFGDLSKYPLWLAKYSSSKGDYNPFMWQHSSTGRIAGISTDVDMNIYYGNMPANENNAESAVKEFSMKRDGNTYISRNFKVSEFRCKDGSNKILIDVDFVQNKLQAIRDHFGAPVTINSGYRTESYNKKVGGAKKSFHMTGQAFDIVVKGHTPAEVARYAQSLDIKGIIQYNSFVHVDGRETKYWAKNNNGKVTVKPSF
ncbi:MAG: DUF882 domain-containing protein [Lachnospiraceae bacterium]|jgi:GH25 family lysozyme M1 (1,4-beta-N-acetylmuramidase)/uncharacterized protein YcbK (DUF882 family)|nr:DUF882 domain-containing protein [Lachnospiraceae bacterium]